MGRDVVCSCWSLLDSRDIKDAWLLQGQGNITITPSPSSAIDLYAAAGAFMIYSHCIDAITIFVFNMIIHRGIRHVGANDWIVLSVQN